MLTTWNATQLATGAWLPYSEGMKIDFTPEQEAKLEHLASEQGVVTEKLVKDAAVRLIEEDARFRTAVRKGIEQADRGELIDEEEMAQRLEQMLKS